MPPKIALICEGKTERAFVKVLRAFVKQRLGPDAPQIDGIAQNGPIPKETKLRKLVQNLLLSKYDHVIALSDLYGVDAFRNQPPEFALRRMTEWAGGEARFHAHLAVHEFEAWLLPYWARIQELSGTDRRCPSTEPERVNHNRPPSVHLKEAWRTGGKSRIREYSKVTDAPRILEGADLLVAVRCCPHLRDLLHTILSKICNQPPLD